MHTKGLRALSFWLYTLVQNMINTDMNILELLLPKSIRDRDVSPKQASKIDMLQSRMSKYIDKISDPSTTQRAREFLKAKLQTDYNELRDVIKTVSESDIVNPEIAAVKNVMYVIVDGQTGKVISKPYESRRRATTRADKLDNEYGAYRYKVRMIDNNPQPVTEAVHKLPLSNADFDLVKELMDKPIPAVIAPIYISEIIDDDEFNDLLKEFEEQDPGMDVRPHIVEWMKRVMPDQMHRFYGGQTTQQREGILSLIHGYDPHMYHGSNDPITGNAYGRR